MIRTTLVLALLLAVPAAHAAFLEDSEDEGNGYVGPRNDEVDLLGVSEQPRVNSRYPFAALVTNNSGLYLDRLSLECTVTDAEGIRLFKDLTFKSSPYLNTALGKTRLGIPPGKTIEVGLYTSNTRWSAGGYEYDCQVFGVSGSQ